MAQGVIFRKYFPCTFDTSDTRISPYPSHPLVVFLKGQSDKLKHVCPVCRLVSGASLKSARNGIRCTLPRNAASAGKTGCSLVVRNSFHVGLICRAFSLMDAALTVSPPLKTFSSGKSRLSVLASWTHTSRAHSSVERVRLFASSANLLSANSRGRNITAELPRMP